MAIIVILCGAPHLYKKDMNNSGLVIMTHVESIILMTYCGSEDKK